MSRNIPKTKGVISLDPKSWLQNTQGHDKVRGQNDVLVKVDAETMRVEVLVGRQDAENALHL